MTNDNINDLFIYLLQSNDHKSIKLIDKEILIQKIAIRTICKEVLATPYKNKSPHSKMIIQIYEKY